MKKPFSPKISHLFAFRSLAKKKKKEFLTIIYNKTSNAELSEQRIPQVLLLIVADLVFAENIFEIFAFFA